MVARAVFVIALLLPAAAHAQSALAAPQTIRGLSIRYDQPFQPREDVAKAIIARQPIPFQRQLIYVEVFGAKRLGVIEEVLVMKSQYSMTISVDIDDAAWGSIQDVRTLDGVRDPSHKIESIRVSDLEARRVSFEANSRTGRFGVEELIILDRSTNTTWMVTMTFSKRKSVPFVDPNIDDRRKVAREVLATVTVKP